MTLYYPIVLPIKAGSTLFLDQAGDHKQVDLTTYQGLIGKLMYLSYGTRPDIVFMVGQPSHHNSDPCIGHLRIAKQILCYLKKMITLDIKWGKDPVGHQLGGKYGELGVVKYADSSYTGNLEDRKLITGYCFFLSGVTVTWCSKQ